MRIFLTPVQIEWLKKNAWGKSHEKIAALFNKRFNSEMTPTKIHSRLSYYGIKIGMQGMSKMVPDGTESVWSSRKNSCMVKVSNKRGQPIWKLKHHFLWERAHGKIPKGYRVIFLDKNRSNFKMSNLALVSSAEILHLTSLGLWFNDTKKTKCGLAIVRHNLAIHRRLSQIMGAEEHKRYRVRTCRKKMKRTK